MAAPHLVAVLDIGKTNAKLALVDLDGLREIEVRRTGNAVVRDGLYPHFDCDRLWTFFLDSLAELRKLHPVDAVSVTAHGAAGALLDAAGELALPILDYEHDGPDALAADYDAVRPPFAESGTPRLPGGLNLGAQFYWQMRCFPDRFAAVRTILTYPQYWAHRLSGVRATEVTSLGAHTDLWEPAKRDFSSLAARLGWRPLMAPLLPAETRLGPVRADIAARTGLDPQTPVCCGIHDSNASLLPHLISRQAPFAVVSTGTWVICMATGGDPVVLDPERDTLMNVNAFGDPVPSARFMGGREYQLFAGEAPVTPGAGDIAAVLSEGIMLLPPLTPGAGPFPHGRGGWRSPREPSPGERTAAASFYLALTTATSLGLIGAAGDIVVEGPFAANALFLEMLATATGRPVLVTQEGATGASIGAALLAREPGTPLAAAAGRIVTGNPGWQDYARRWRQEAPKPG